MDSRIQKVTSRLEMTKSRVTTQKGCETVVFAQYSAAARASMAIPSSEGLGVPAQTRRQASSAPPHSMRAQEGSPAMGNCLPQAVPRLLAESEARRAAAAPLQSSPRSPRTLPWGLLLIPLLLQLLCYLKHLLHEVLHLRMSLCGVEHCGWAACRGQEVAVLSGDGRWL